MRKLIKSAAIILFGLAACSAQNDPVEFELQNGIRLPVHELGRIQTPCEVFGQKLDQDPARVCIEFPSSALGEEFEPLNWYAAELKRSGFEWASGAANQYWFDWPENEACFLRLNLTALPKERIEGDDWSDLEVYVAMFEFEDERKCDQS
ncbi:MAG: hypothetical protein NXH78_15315 [Hyphomonadaceae bacterium]|nr:hypothetical protein [Hyphomonadaceae bacterium]